MARERRSKKEVIEAKISTMDKKIEEYNKKIGELTEQRTALATQLEELNEAEKKAQEEAEMKEVLKLIRKSKISVGELKEMIETKGEVAATEE